MKKIFTCIFITAAAQSMAQKQGSHITAEIRSPYSVPSSRAIDTVSLPPVAAACIPNLMIGLLTSGSDQLGGTNTFGDKEKAQFFTYTGGGNITGVIVPFGMKKANSGTTNYTVNLYDATTAATSPGVLLGTSQSIAFSAIDTADANTFMFTSSVSVSDNFFASVIVSPGNPTDDTVAVLQFFDGTNPSNSCGNGTAWEKQFDNTWHPFNGSLSTEWGADIQLAIFPIIDNSTAGIEDLSPVTTHKLYPNPASEVVNVSYALNITADVTFTLTDINGKIMYTSAQAALPAGAYNQTVDISALATGVYNYSITTGTHTISSKLMVR